MGFNFAVWRAAGHFWSFLIITILASLLIVVIIFQIVTMTVVALSMTVLSSVSVFLVPVFIAVSIWFSVFYYAVLYGLQGIIYRRLKTGA